MKLPWRWLVGVPVAALALAQLVPVDRANPPVEQDAGAPPEVQAVLRRACYDCHSHETVWGPHTYVAPISWLTVNDVREGREELNFSRWGRERPGRVARKLREVVADGEMPPWLYVLAHPSARLSAGDRAALLAWADALSAQAGPDEEERGRGRGRRGRGR